MWLGVNKLGLARLLEVDPRLKSLSLSLGSKTSTTRQTMQQRRSSTPPSSSSKLLSNPKLSTLRLSIKLLAWLRWYHSLARKMLGWARLHRWGDMLRLQSLASCSQLKLANKKNRKVLLRPKKLLISHLIKNLQFAIELRVTRMLQNWYRNRDQQALYLERKEKSKTKPSWLPKWSRVLHLRISTTRPFSRSAE